MVELTELNEYCYLDFYRTRNSLMLKFQDWCDKFNDINPFIDSISTIKDYLTGKYIKVLNDTNKKHYGIKKGDYLLFNKIEDDCEYWGEYGVKHYHGQNVHKNEDFELMPEGFDPSNENIMNNDDLLEEAKRRYPIGTKFISVSGRILIVTNSNHMYLLRNNIIVSTDEGNGETIKNGASIYYNGKWAEIVSTPEPKNIINKLPDTRINHNFNEPIKSNNVLLLNTVIQPIKIETISDKLNIIKQVKILTLK